MYFSYLFLRITAKIIDYYCEQPKKILFYILLIIEESDKLFMITIMRQTGSIFRYFFDELNFSRRWGFEGSEEINLCSGHVCDTALVISHLLLLIFFGVPVCSFKTIVDQSPVESSPFDVFHSVIICD